ncbi:MAG: hypothetical protein RLZZ612_1481 [Pseudomonadota bacterium]
MRLDMGIWYHQQESNLYLALRRHSFYPLNYGGAECVILLMRAGVNHIKGVVLAGLGTQRQAAGEVVEQAQCAHRPA